MAIQLGMLLEAVSKKTFKFVLLYLVTKFRKVPL